MEPLRLDKWASVADVHTSVPFEKAPGGGVFRGMPNLDDAKLYADQVAEFFSANGYFGPVFVVRGPTSTTQSKFEVVDASCSYSVAYKTPMHPQYVSKFPGLDINPAVTEDTSAARRRMRP